MSNRLFKSSLTLEAVLPSSRAPCDLTLAAGRLPLGIVAVGVCYVYVEEIVRSGLNSKAECEEYGFMASSHSPADPRGLQDAGLSCSDSRRGDVTSNKAPKPSKHDLLSYLGAVACRATSIGNGERGLQLERRPRITFRGPAL